MPTSSSFSSSSSSNASSSSSKFSTIKLRSSSSSLKSESVDGTEIAEAGFDADSSDEFPTPAYVVSGLSRLRRLYRMSFRILRSVLGERESRSRSSMSTSSLIRMKFSIIRSWQCGHTSRFSGLFIVLRLPPGGVGGAGVLTNSLNGGRSNHLARHLYVHPLLPHMLVILWKIEELGNLVSFGFGRPVVRDPLLFRYPNLSK
ncbi:hypothetical protein OGATHE_004787 [Ogataea polymorpha]|uniref:Uncharacterized protein n=1 Tax=Ogataea polymorpha TaxID=460523 RepID=A0A9P8T235_9ASCO|nr:hypothetical protein OGATHE_004787 [Ogataea polymorpha]